MFHKLFWLKLKKKDLLPVRYVPVSYTHLTLPTTVALCRSRWSAYQ
nr:hypothetical protein [Elizabethkingia sp. ASV34]